MAPPVKTFKNSKNYMEYKHRSIPDIVRVYDSSKTYPQGGGNFVPAFLPKDDSNSERELRRKFSDAIAHMGYDNRNGQGFNLLLYMLGQQKENGDPSFSVEDILDPNKLRDEKLQAYYAFINVQRDDTLKKQIDKAYLRGSNRAISYIDSIVTNAFQDPDKEQLLLNDTKTIVVLNAINTAINSVRENAYENFQNRVSSDTELIGLFSSFKRDAYELIETAAKMNPETATNFSLYSILGITETKIQEYKSFEDHIFLKKTLDDGIVTIPLSKVIAMSILKGYTPPHTASFPLALTGCEIPLELYRVINAEYELDFDNNIKQPEIKELGSREAKTQVEQKYKERKEKLEEKLAPLNKLRQEIEGNAQLMAGMLVMSRCGDLFSGSVIPTGTKNGRLVLTDIDAINISIPTKEELYRACIESGIQYDMEKRKDASHYNDLVKAGLVKLPLREDAYNAENTVNDRSNILQELENEVKANSVFKPSVEWQLMEKSFARAKRANAELIAGNNSPEKMTALAGAMADLQAAADRYLQFKLNQPDFIKSSDRINLASRIKHAAQREAAQLAPLAKEYRDNYRNNPTSSEGLPDHAQSFSEILEEFAAVSGSSTQKFDDMEKALKDAKKSADNLAKLIKKASKSESDLTQYYYDYQKNLYAAQQRVEEYLAHKELNNNHSVRSERRIIVAKEAKAFLDSALPAIYFRTVSENINKIHKGITFDNSIADIHTSLKAPAAFSIKDMMSLVYLPPCSTREDLNNRREQYRDAMMPLLTIACLKGRNLEMTALRQEVLDILNDDGEMKDKFDKIAALEVKNRDKTYRPFANVIAYAASNPNFLVENFALEYDSLMSNLSFTFTPAWQNGKIQSLTEKFGPIKQPNVAEKVVQPNPKEDRDASHKEEHKNENVNVSNAEFSNIEAPNVDVSNIEVPVEVPNVETKANRSEQPSAEMSGIEVPDEDKPLLKEIEADCLKSKFPEALFPNVQKSFADLSKIHFEQAPKTPEEVKQRQEQYKNAMMPLLTYALFKAYPDSGYGEYLKNQLNNTNNAFDEKQAKEFFDFVYNQSDISRARSLFDQQINRSANDPHYVDRLLKGNLENLTFSVKPKLSEGLKELLDYSGLRNILSEELTNAQIQLENLPPVSDEQERNKIVRESIAPFICAAIMYDDYIETMEQSGSAQTIYYLGGSKELMNLIAESSYAKDISKSILDGKQTIKSFLEQKPEDFVKGIHDIKPTFKGELDKLLDKVSRKDHSLGEGLIKLFDKDKLPKSLEKTLNNAQESLKKFSKTPPEIWDQENVAKKLIVPFISAALMYREQKAAAEKTSTEKPYNEKTSNEKPYKMTEAYNYSSGRVNEMVYGFSYVKDYCKNIFNGEISIESFLNQDANKFVEAIDVLEKKRRTDHPQRAKRNEIKSALQQQGGVDNSEPKKQGTMTSLKEEKIKDDKLEASKDEQRMPIEHIDSKECPLVKGMHFEGDKALPEALMKHLRTAQTILEKVPNISNKEEQRDLVQKAIAPFVCAAIILGDRMENKNHSGKLENAYNKDSVDRRFLNSIANFSYVKEICDNIVNEKTSVDSFLKQDPNAFVDSLYALEKKRRTDHPERTKSSEINSEQTRNKLPNEIISTTLDADLRKNMQNGKMPEIMLDYLKSGMNAMKKFAAIPVPPQNFEQKQRIKNRYVQMLATIAVYSHVLEERKNHNAPLGKTEFILLTRKNNEIDINTLIDAAKTEKLQNYAEKLVNHPTEAKRLLEMKESDIEAITMDLVPELNPYKQPEKESKPEVKVQTKAGPKQHGTLYNDLKAKNPDAFKIIEADLSKLEAALENKKNPEISVRSLSNVLAVCVMDLLVFTETFTISDADRIGEQTLPPIAQAAKTQPKEFMDKIAKDNKFQSKLADISDDAVMVSDLLKQTFSGACSNVIDILDGKKPSSFLPDPLPSSEKKSTSDVNDAKDEEMGREI